MANTIDDALNHASPGQGKQAQQVINEARSNIQIISVQQMNDISSPDANSIVKNAEIMEEAKQNPPIFRIYKGGVRQDKPASVQVWGAADALTASRKTAKTVRRSIAAIAAIAEEYGVPAVHFRQRTRNEETYLVVYCNCNELNNQAQAFSFLRALAKTLRLDIPVSVADLESERSAPGDKLLFENSAQKSNAKG